MGLTRITAQQISNIDYKQSVRVVTTTNITLAGGAPNTVDGVSLATNNRVLVTGQSTGSQNGLYYVTTVGAGSTGTWVRSTDGDTTGEIDAGMIVMVTEGTVYADTQWKLTTDDPITIGTTALTFVQNYLANSISAGTSNVSVVSSANVNISSAGTANVFTVSSTGTVVSGTESVSGNITGGNILTAGLVSATGSIIGAVISIPAGALTLTNQGSVNDIIAGTKNVGQVIIGGTTQTGAITIGQSTASQNILIGTGATGSGNTKTINIGTSGAANSTTSIVLGLTSVAGGIGVVTVPNATTVAIANTSATALSVAGNITGGNLVTAGLISATGTAATGVNAAQFGVPNVALHSVAVITLAGNSNQSSQFAFQNFSSLPNASADIAVYNNLGTDTSYFIDMGIVSNTYNGTTAGANVFNANDGYLYVAGNSITGPVGSGANIGNLIIGTTNGQIKTWVGNTSTSNIVTVTSNTGFAVTGIVSATGNITAPFFFGNGSQLTGITGGGGGSSITNGTSNVVVASSGNVTVGVAGTAAVTTFATTGIFVPGLASVTGNVNVGNAAGVTYANAGGVRAWTYYNNAAASLDTVFL